MQKNNMKKINLFKWAQRAVGIVLAASYIAAIYSVINTNMAPTKYLVFAVPVSFLVVVLLVIANFKAKKLSRSKKIGIIIASFIMIVANIFVSSISSDLMSLLNNIQDDGYGIITESDQHIKLTKPFTLYISGIDTYGDISTMSRSDVNIMVVINPQTHKILLVNTPRDYYVQLHGTTGLKDKLTHSGIYGINMSVNTMEDLYSVPINYYLRINFSSLTKIIDALGGVDVNSQYKFTADGYLFNVGVNHLNGNQALAFSRERHSFEGGDRTRGSNQELVIEAIIAKMNDSQTIINYQQILASLNGVIQTNMSSSDISKLISAQLNDMSKWNVESIGVTGTDSNNYTYSMGNIPLYVMEPDMTSVDTAKQAIQQYL